MHEQEEKKKNGVPTTTKWIFRSTESFVRIPTNYNFMKLPTIKSILSEIEKKNVVAVWLCVWSDLRATVTYWRQFHTNSTIIILINFSHLMWFLTTKSDKVQNGIPQWLSRPIVQCWTIILSIIRCEKLCNAGSAESKASSITIDTHTIRFRKKKIYGKKWKQFVVHQIELIALSNDAIY